MVNRNNTKTKHELDSQNNGDSFASVDYRWFATRFESLFERMAAFENSLGAIEQSVSTSDAPVAQPTTREYYSVQEFAAEVGRSKYTVREWCRFERIHAEKCDTGRGEAKCWKIPVEELGRYRDHGLLPVGYYSKD